MKVLLVDDDQALQTVYTTALSQDGFTVVNAYDGKSGLESAKTEGPDVILLDQVLPDLQGNEILKMLKADDGTTRIPVAMLSNFGQNELIQDAINSGALDYILKYQIEPADLVAKLKTLVPQVPGATPAPQAASAPMTPPAPTQPPATPVTPAQTSPAPAPAPTPTPDTTTNSGTGSDTGSGTPPPQQPV